MALKNDPVAECMNYVSRNMMDVVDYWRLHGDDAHGARGFDFVLHCMGAVYNYTVACEFMRHRVEQQEELNRQASRPGGFANLDIPRDLALMIALLPAVVREGARAEILAGSGVDERETISVHRYLREAARLAVRLCDAPPSPDVARYLDLSDDDLRAEEETSALNAMQPAGRG